MTGRAGWHGRLELRYRFDAGRTDSEHRHSGPLRVLRSLYPEGPSICHQVLVHPPGGIVGGDTLDIDVDVGCGAHALITTPGATRFYRSGGSAAVQCVAARVDDGARLEWLPLETIAWPGTRASNRMRFELAPRAQMLGWDLLALGLPAAGQPFDAGCFEQQIELPGIWLDRGTVDAGTAFGQRLLDSPLGWDRRTALATLWCAAGTGWPAATLEALLSSARDLLETAPAGDRGGASSPDARIVVVRALAGRTEPLWATLKAIRDRWRTILWGLAPDSPRIWGT